LTSDDYGTGLVGLQQVAFTLFCQILAELFGELQFYAYLCDDMNSDHDITPFTDFRSQKEYWGTNAISNGGNAANSGWRTLTGGDSGEWNYLFNSRSASTVIGTENARFAKAKLFDTTYGVILFPDSYTHPDGVDAPTGINKTDGTSWDGNKYSAADWSKMEEAGCVFLPAAGCRKGTTVDSAGSYGGYWSSSPDGSNAVYAYGVGFGSGDLNPAGGIYRYYGFSVRLVRLAE